MILYLRSRKLNKPMCRNWQTRQTQNLLFLWTCGFESHHRHFYHMKNRCFLAVFCFIRNRCSGYSWLPFSFHNSLTLSTGNLSSISAASNKFCGNSFSPMIERYSSTALRSIIILPCPAQ